MNKLTLLSFFLLFNVVRAQNIETGTYVGFEQNPFCYSDTCNIDYRKIRLRKNQLYYLLTLNVSQNKTTLTKIPVIYKNKRKQIIDSAKGGYYLYGVEQYDDKIYSKLKKARYNSKPGSGVPRYVDANYTFVKTKNGILISNKRNKNIMLRKLK